MRILVVEDEQRLREQLQYFLQQQGYVVDTAPDGEEGLYQGREYACDLAVIDIGLPKMNGLEIIKTLRAEGFSYPILILTARDQWHEKVEGLEAGADDYLVKPFHNQELKARINALLRRSAGHASPELHFGDITINTASKLVTLKGAPLTLTSYEYNTLEYLAHHNGRVISKTELTDHLYAEDLERDSNVLEVFIGRLRKKLDPDGTLQPIATHRGQGYRFTLTADKD